MRTAKPRPIIKVHAYYDGTYPFVDAYADVIAMLLREKMSKSSIRTFDCREPFHYGLPKPPKEYDRNGTAS